MTFQDVFNSNFLSQVTSLSAVDMIIAQFLALALGLFIYYVYLRTYRGVMYSHSFGVSLVALTMITALVIQAVTSNVVLSLGMVGALSIVRFRSAIKEPLDIAYLFWALASGIVLGAGLIPLAIFGSVVIGVTLTIFVVKKPHDTPYLLVVHCQDDAVENAVLAQISNRSQRTMVKAKTVNQEGVELTLELRLKDGATQFVNDISRLPGVRDAVLVTYNGEYME